MTNYIHVEKCIAYDNLRHGYNIVTGSKNVVITNSQAYNNGRSGTSGCGITAQNNGNYKTNTVEFTNNNIKNNRYGICVNDVYNVKILNNVIDNKTVCFQFTKTRNVEVQGTNCRTKKS